MEYQDDLEFRFIFRTALGSAYSHMPTDGNKKPTKAQIAKAKKDVGDSSAKYSGYAII